MKWLAFLFRPMALKQFAAVVSYESAVEVMSICTSLLIIIVDNDKDRDIGSKDENKIFKLAHFSVKEYLILQHLQDKGVYWYQFSSQLAHKPIATTALNCLLYSEDLTKLSLLDYSTRFWSMHTKNAKNTTTHSDLQAKINSLFSAEHSVQ